MAGHHHASRSHNSTKSSVAQSASVPTSGLWIGKCFRDDNAGREGGAGGAEVTNRIRMRISSGNSSDRAVEVEAFPGVLNTTGKSFFAPGEDAAVIRYPSAVNATGDQHRRENPGRNESHVLSEHIEELREIYPGVWLGKTYALQQSGSSNTRRPDDADGALSFSFNYLLFANQAGAGGDRGADFKPPHGAGTEM